MQWNALLIGHYFNPFGTTQLEKAVKKVKFGSLKGEVGLFCGLPSPFPFLVAAIICVPAKYGVVHLVILEMILRIFLGRRRG